MADTKQVTLSDGKVATIRRPKGRDLIRAHDAAGDGANRFKFTCAMLAQIVTLDGRACVFEDVQELYASDIDRLAGEASGDFLSSGAPSSSSSSSTDSGSAS